MGGVGGECGEVGGIAVGGGGESVNILMPIKINIEMMMNPNIHPIT